MGVSGRGPLPAPSHAAEAAQALTLGLMDKGCAPSLGAQEDLHLAWVPDFLFFAHPALPQSSSDGAACVQETPALPAPQASCGCSLATRVPAMCGNNGAAGAPGLRTADSPLLSRRFCRDRQWPSE